MSKNQEKHILKEWCVNCYAWSQPKSCIRKGHQDPILKCVKCGKFFEMDVLFHNVCEGKK